MYEASTLDHDIALCINLYDSTERRVSAVEGLRGTSGIQFVLIKSSSS